jgi:hypothetical protein
MFTDSKGAQKQSRAWLQKGKGELVARLPIIHLTEN